MVYDLQCQNKECAEIQTDVLVRHFEDTNPPCPVCHAPTERIMAIRRYGPNANEASVRFHFNYPDPND